MCCDYHMNIPGKGKEDKTGGQNFGFCESFYTYNVMKQKMLRSHTQKFTICIFCLFPITVACFSIIFSDKVKDTACCATKPSIFSAAYFPTSLYWKKTSQVFSSNQSLGWLVDQSFDWLVSQSINQSIDAIDSVDKFTLHTLISVCIFSILFSIHFLRCWLGEFV